VELLLSGRAANINAVCAMVPMEKWCDELDLSLAASDGLHAHLRTEYEAGRLLRLLVKLGMINERPEQTIAGARDWSETGDRYILKLFRDFLFHQTILDGSAPSVDAGHVIASLNKLDLADAEKILLSSRNNKDLLVVSYADVHRYETFLLNSRRSLKLTVFLNLYEGVWTTPFLSWFAYPIWPRARLQAPWEACL
jgi:PAB-dependent poly(A)-specific ribonuclease subunit 3